MSKRGAIRFATTGWLLVASLWLAAPAFAAEAPDPWITTKVKLSLLTSDGVDGLAVNVDTSEGRVTLHGTASTAAEKVRAEQLARQVEGVREVRSLIQVVPDTAAKKVEASDDQIRARVAEALKAEPSLANSSIDVASVNKGVVLLEGTADSLSSHLRAIEIAHDVDGVRRVASEVKSPDELADAEIWRDKGDRDVAAAPGTRSMARDMWITTESKVRLMAADVPTFDVNVDTQGGVVTLFGSVGSQTEKSTAEAEVKKVDGVRMVRNELQIVPKAQQAAKERKDEQVREAVEQRLEDRDELGDADIKVEVANGVVRLTGKVASQTDRLAALTTARSSEGVRSVVGDLRVE